MIGDAVGILEVFGLTAAFVAGDAGCKAADVTLEVFDKNKPVQPIKGDKGFQGRVGRSK